MFNFIKRIKQINGYSPIQTLLLGEFAFREIRKSLSNGETTSQKERQNIAILLEFYETNSAQIVVKTFDKEERFHLLQRPLNFDIFSVEVQSFINSKKFLFVKDVNLCALLDDIDNSAKVYLNN